MDDSPPKAAALPTSKKRQTKRLLFDRRYGWVFDEWKEPSEEALVGGRGMFCILPLAKAVANVASESVSYRFRVFKSICNVNWSLFKIDLLQEAFAPSVRVLVRT